MLKSTTCAEEDHDEQDHIFWRSLLQKTFLFHRDIK